jgi:hypothetical protein
MRAWILIIAGFTTLSSLPAHADRRHGGGHSRTYVSLGYTYGYPFGYGFYSPFYSPWYYGPRLGVGVVLGNRYPVRRARSQRSDDAEQHALKLYVYPAAGQSDAQLADDRYQCHVWGADQSGYDPTLGAGSRDQAESYTRAFTACMEGRHYVVK